MSYLFAPNRPNGRQASKFSVFNPKNEARNPLLPHESFRVAQYSAHHSKTSKHLRLQQERLPAKPKTLPQCHKLLGYRPKGLSQETKRLPTEPKTLHSAPKD